MMAMNCSSYHSWNNCLLTLKPQISSYSYLMNELLWWSYINLLFSLLSLKILFLASTTGLVNPFLNKPYSDPSVIQLFCQLTSHYLFLHCHKNPILLRYHASLIEVLTSFLSSHLLFLKRYHLFVMIHFSY
jgi:hypothetical protein